MVLNQIKYFVVLARTLHFTKAAEECNVSQPALTKAIRNLEDELGGKLFLRERSRTQLTDLGRAMLVPLARALASAHDAKAQAAAFHRRDISPLRIGLEYSVSAAVLTPVLIALRRHSDSIELSLRHGAQADLCERLLDGSLDFALLVEAAELPERLHRWPMFAERHVLVCLPEHGLRDHTTVDIDDLVNECLLLNDDAACPVRRFVTEAFATRGMRPRRQQFATNQEQLLEMVLAELGVSVLGERTPIPPPLLRRPFANDPDGRAVVLAAVAGRQLGPTPALFLKMMRARAWSMDETGVSPQAVAA